MKRMGVIFELAAILVLLFAFIPPLISMLQPKAAPVITPLVIERIFDREGGVRLVGHAERLRDCQFEKLHWRLGRRHEVSVPVDVDFIDPPAIRSTGMLHWDGILIGITADQVVNNSHATVEYKCSEWFPHVMQPWYDGDGKDSGLLYQRK